MFMSLISNVSCVDHLGQSCFPLEAIYIIYNKALFVQIFYFFFTEKKFKKESKRAADASSRGLFWNIGKRRGGIS